MCRHALPRFDFPVGQIIHNLGRFVASHQVAAFAVVLVPLCAAVALMACGRMRRPAAARWSAPRTVLAGLRRSLIGDRFGPARPV